jgi:hypothetical protein
MTDNIAWGSDGVISMPQALDTTDTAMADMEGFCFTPDGLRVNISHADREDILSRGYGPQFGGEQ